MLRGLAVSDLKIGFLGFGLVVHLPSFRRSGLSGGSRPAVFSGCHLIVAAGRSLLEHLERQAALRVQRLGSGKVAKRRRATSTYRGSISSPSPRRPARSAAIKVVPEPANASSTMPPRFEQSLIASSTSATGLTVGCRPESRRGPAKTVHAGIAPHIGAVAAMAAELDIVDMRRRCRS